MSVGMVLKCILINCFLIVILIIVMYSGERRSYFWLSDLNWDY